MPESLPRLGIACPLPPAPTGPATYLARMLPALAEHADITCFVPDPQAVDPALRATWRVRHLDERAAAGCDLVVYHLANNPLHREVLTAALAGPPGLVVLHDASLHHLLTHELVASARLDEYERWLEDAHGPRGATVGAARLYGGTEIEQFVFEALGPVLDRHLAVQTHSRYAAAIVEHRCPGLPVHVVPHFAPVAQPAQTDALPELVGKLVVGHFGYITKPKRYDVLCAAMEDLLAVEPDAHLVFAGCDDTHGDLDRVVRAHRLEGAVTVTGWMPVDEFDAIIDRVDIAVSLRWPQVGESSGTLASLLGAGKPTVIEAVGSWSELPPNVVVRLDGGDRVALACALIDLAQSEAHRRTVGEAAKEYAKNRLSIERCAAEFAGVARGVAEGPRRPPVNTSAANRDAVRGFLAGGAWRLSDALGRGGPISDRERAAAHARLELLRTLPPARAGASLAALDLAPPMVRVLAQVWGYDAVGVLGTPPEPRARHATALDPAAGLPAMDVQVRTADLAGGARLPFDAGSCDVVVWWDPTPSPAVDLEAMLAEVNRVLTPNGLLHLAWPVALAPDVTALERAGLALHAESTIDGGTSVVQARKAGLPADRFRARPRS